MHDCLDGWCDECVADTRHEVTDFDAGWTRGVCLECGTEGWYPTGP